MSQSAAPWGAIVGEMPLNVIGPLGIMVMVPMVKRVGSALDTATRVTFAGEFVLFVCAGVIAVGTLEGAM